MEQSGNRRWTMLTAVAGMIYGLFAASGVGSWLYLLHVQSGVSGSMLAALDSLLGNEKIWGKLVIHGGFVLMAAVASAVILLKKESKSKTAAAAFFATVFAGLVLFVFRSSTALLPTLSAVLLLCASALMHRQRA